VRSAYCRSLTLASAACLRRILEHPTKTGLAEIFALARLARSTYRNRFDDRGSFAPACSTDWQELTSPGIATYFRLCLRDGIFDTSFRRGADNGDSS